jgi:hypothetical protein
MNGLDMSLKDKISGLDRHTFIAPSNVVLPDAVGNFLRKNILYVYTFSLLNRLAYKRLCNTS